MKHDYTYYWTHNVSISTSGNYNTRGLKFCIDEIGLDRCMYAIGRFSFEGRVTVQLTTTDTPYDSVEEAQKWWASIDLPEGQKEAVARTNAIRLFKLPLVE
jgi:2,3-dihydroxybenzoate decarboxylase